jgi:hypothetical protein
LSGIAPGKRERRLGVLHRSSILLLTAAFEAYCEGILIASVGTLSKSIPMPANLPKELRKNVALQNGVAKDKNELYSWEFANTGWRELTVGYSQKRVSALNTPNAGNLRILFCDLLGIEDITASWGRRAEDARDTLDEWLEHRHGIAHGAEDTPVLVLADVTSYENFLRQTVSRTDKTVENHLTSLLGQSPW